MKGLSYAQLVYVCLCLTFRERSHWENIIWPTCFLKEILILKVPTLYLRLLYRNMMYNSHVRQRSWWKKILKKKIIKKQKLCWTKSWSKKIMRNIHMKNEIMIKKYPRFIKNNGNVYVLWCDTYSLDMRDVLNQKKLLIFFLKKIF